MNKYRLPTSIYDRKNDKEVTDEDIKRNFKAQSDILINATSTEIKEIEDKQNEKNSNHVRTSFRKP